jgi:hypothetical protein
MAYASYNPSCTAGAANTKGAYTQVVASTPFASSRVYLTPEYHSAAWRFVLVDVATGAAGAETVIVANIAGASDMDAIASGFTAIDVDIPAGSRVAVRAQSATGGTIPALGLVLEDRALGSLANPVTYGTDLTNSRGFTVDPGGTANTKGAYAVLAASTSARMDAVLLCVTAIVQGVSLTAARWLLDVATGAAGAETVLVPNLVFVSNANNDVVRPELVRFPVAIPAGTRVTVRAQCTDTGAFSRLLAVTLIGMQEPTPASGGGPTAVAYVG